VLSKRVTRLRGVARSIVQRMEEEFDVNSKVVTAWQLGNCNCAGLMEVVLGERKLLLHPRPKNGVLRCL